MEDTIYINDDILTDSVFQAALDTYGEDEQIRQATGECGEFVAAAQNYHRTKKFSRTDTTIVDLMEEAVDTFIMMRQIRHIDVELFDKIYETKVLKIRRKLLLDTE